MAEPLYFWREFEQPHGYLSQWYVAPFTVGETTYATTEMYMMVHKARLFGDTDSEAKMLATTDPGTHRDLGRTVTGFNRSLWDQNKERIVEEGNWAKFGPVGMREKLLATGERELVEASPYDRIWGVGFGADDAGRNRDKWGLNLLGKALTRVRDRLREQDGS